MAENNIKQSYANRDIESFHMNNLTAPCIKDNHREYYETILSEQRHGIVVHEQSILFRELKTTTENTKKQSYANRDIESWYK